MLLTRRMKYDRLGVNDGLLPEPNRLVPLLDQIASDSRVVEIARQRARTLADRFHRSP